MFKALKRIFPNFLLFILFLLLLSSFSYNLLIAQSEKVNDVFRVMTYNIRYAGNEETDGVNAWSNRKKLVASMIRFNHADIIGLQEALLLQLNDLTELLSGYSWIGVGRDDGENKGEFSAILFRNDRFEIMRHSTFWLSDKPDKPSMGWDAAFPRVVTWAKMKDKETGKTFFIFNTHYDHIGETARINSSKLLKNRITEIVNDQSIIVMGDLNTQDSTEAYQILIDHSDDKIILYDAQSKSETEHHGSNVTFNGFGTSIEPGNKIDFIFVSKDVLVLQHGVIDETVDGRYPSDHMPVIAEIAIK
jgi:endonuclease/exonuclease/phosphatase family metal-dependent hydrolase